jgi:glycosyltransferase involved in cell wall biosynthesis
MTEITALIRYKNSAKTLPEVLNALQRQSLRPKKILAVDTGSTDGSTRILQESGAQILQWHDTYHHSRVLNFGLSACQTDLVLCLSSHTVMNENDTVERLAKQFENPHVCASSIKWDEDPYYSDCINWKELQEKGIKFGSIYSNSLGLIRRKVWQDYTFDESINGMEDYDWAIRQLKAGHCVARLKAPIHYQRNAHNRDMRETARTFFLADRYGLAVRWLGVSGSIRLIVCSFPGRLIGIPSATKSFATGRHRLLGALFWKAFDLNID